MLRKLPISYGVFGFEKSVYSYPYGYFLASGR